MRQLYAGVEYDAGVVFAAVQKKLGIQGSREGEVKEVFRKTRQWYRTKNPGHTFGYQTINNDFARYLGLGCVPDCMLAYYLDEIVTATSDATTE